MSQNAVCDETFFAASVFGVRISVKTATLTAQMPVRDIGGIKFSNKIIET